jgi:transposase-like protein
MENYPKNLIEFEQNFNTEEQCRDYLFKLRWQNGFICSRCKCEKYYRISGLLFKCAGCGYQGSVIAGTIFQDTHKPLTLWFRAIWYLTAQKNGVSALNIQKILGLGSYRTAWTWLHKLRRAMVRPDRELLHGVVEVDETYIGATKLGSKRGRGAENKVLVAVAVELEGNNVGRVRLKVIPDVSSNSLYGFVKEAVVPKSKIITDGWTGYNNLVSNYFEHEVKIQNDDTKLLPHVHTVVSLLRRWLLGTLQGSCSKEHFAYYLDEFAFRFNRRKSKSRGMLFYRLLQNAVQIEPKIYKTIINHKT